MTDKQYMLDWLRRHNACAEGYAWAESECGSLADVWRTAKPEWLLWVATRQGVLSDRDLRIFACRCVRRVWHLLTDERSRNAVEVAERYAAGEATDAELSAARDAAWDARNAAWAARDAAWDARDAAWAARDAAWDAASAAAWDAASAASAAAWAAASAASAAAWDAASAAASAASAAAWDAASAAAWDAASAAAWDAASAAAWDAWDAASAAARTEIAADLRTLTPNFVLEANADR